MNPDQPFDPFAGNPTTPAFVAEPEKKPAEPKQAPRRSRPVTKSQVDPKAARAVLALVRDLDKMNSRDRDLMAGLYQTAAVVDDLVVAVLSGVEPATQHILDVVAAAETADQLDAMVDVQTYADATPERFRTAWATLAEVDDTLPKTARPGPKAAAQFVRAAKALDKATLIKLRAPLALVR